MPTKLLGGLTVDGVPVTGSGVDALPITGNVFYVNSSTGVDDPSYGTTVARPFDTLDYAIGKCTASNGDVIYLLPGHTETIGSASAITVDVAGISIIGLGNGNLRPTFTWSATAGTIVVSAANVTIKNIICTISIDEVVSGDFADGRIGYAPTNASWQSFVTGLRVLRGEDGARQWLEEFATQEPVAYEGNSQVRDAVDTGEVQIGLINHYYLFELIAEKGAEGVTALNQFMAPGDPGGLVNVAGAGILASSDQQEQALALVDYLTGEKAQAFFAQQTSEYPVVGGVAAPEGLPSLESLEAPAIDLSDLDSIAATQALLAEVGLLTQ